MALPSTNISGSQKASDTISVTVDGRTIVDVQKLMEKDHIRAMLKEIRKKTTYRKSRTRRIPTLANAL
jgi:hypothetical protein